jgi:hypothetical protein
VKHRDIIFDERIHKIKDHFPELKAKR